MYRSTMCFPDSVEREHLSAVEADQDKLRDWQRRAVEVLYEVDENFNVKGNIQNKLAALIKEAE